MFFEVDFADYGGSEIARGDEQSGLFLCCADGLRNQAQLVRVSGRGDDGVVYSVAVRVAALHDFNDRLELVQRGGVDKPHVVHERAVDPYLRIRVCRGAGRRRDGGKRRFKGFVVRLIFRGDFQLYHEQRKYVERKRANFVCAKLA